MKFFVYCAYLLGAILTLDYFAFYRPVRKQMLAKEEWLSGPILTVGEADVKTMTHFGGRWLGDESASSFVHFQTNKSASLRVCAFGDSFVYGTEAPTGSDFPSLLQRRLRALGLNAEVLNFGKGWVGFGQAYHLWEQLSEKYSCDIALFGPGTFFSERELGFCHLDALTESPRYIHARYIIEKFNPKLVDPGGVTFEERFDSIFGFIPSWNALRYQRSAPLALLAPIIRLTPGRTLANPFYYTDQSADSESNRIFHTLLFKLSQSAKRIIVISEKDRILEAVKTYETPQFSAVKTTSCQEFPFRAPNGHCSSYGNEFIAAQVAKEISRKPIRTPLIPIISPPETQPELSAFPFSCQKLELSSGEQIAGELFELVDQGVARSARPFCPHSGTLLFLYGPHNSIASSYIFHLPAPVRSLKLLAYYDNKWQPLARYEVRGLAKDLALAAAEIPELDTSVDGRYPKITLRLPPQAANTKEIKIVADGRVITQGYRDAEQYRLTVGRIGRFRVTQALAENNFAIGESISLLITRSDVTKRTKVGVVLGEKNPLPLTSSLATKSN